MIEAGGKKQLITPPKENRFTAIGLNDAEGTWQVVWDERGIYLNAVTLAGGRSVPARYEMTPDADWPQHSSWDEAGRVANLLLAQAAEGVRVVSGEPRSERTRSK